MTFDDDRLLVQFPGGARWLACKLNGIEWPPSERLTLSGFTFKRVRMSTITDEQRADMTHVFRGAEYKPEPSSTFPSEKT